MSQTSDIVQPTRWKDQFGRLTKVHEGDELTIDILSEEFGDEYEAEWLPLAYLEYGPKDDVFIVAVGGRNRRYPILRHFIPRPRSINLDAAGQSVPLAIEVVGGDDSRTIVSIRPASSGDEG